MDTGTSINLKSDVLEKLKNALNDSSYRETIESSSNYNNRLVVERKTRVPFIDSQTGVAQNDCYLWMQKWERMPGTTDGQLYSYPKKRWRKKKRSQYLINNNYGLSAKSWEKNQPDKISLEVNCLNGHEVKVEPVLNDGSHEQPVVDKFFENANSKDDWMNELDDVNDFNDTIDNDDNESDYDDEYSSKKKKKKKDNLLSTGKKKKSSAPQTELSSNDKPYKCDLCGMKYKTRPGLSYHYSHTHSVDVENRKQISALEEEDSQQSNSSLGTTGANGFNSRSSQISNSTSNSPLPPNSFNNNSQTKSHLTNNVPIPPPTLNNNSINKNDKSASKPTTPSSYCDFCLGNAEINKRTRTSEEMISCHKCGRSAHPTCLQFTPNMVKSVKSYPWECLECKSCGICGASDNDESILFCDSCDAGYHTDCVGLKEIPEGEWSCNRCIEEYHKEKLTESNNINSNSNNSNSSTNLNNANLNTNNNNTNNNNITNNSHSKQQSLTTDSSTTTNDKS